VYIVDGWGGACMGGAECVCEAAVVVDVDVDVHRCVVRA
jgi:hypothetical protein